MRDVRKIENIVSEPTCMIRGPPAFVLRLLFGSLLSVLFHLGLALLIPPLGVVHHLSQFPLPLFSSVTIALFSRPATVFVMTPAVITALAVTMPVTSAVTVFLTISVMFW